MTDTPKGKSIKATMLDQFSDRLTSVEVVVRQKSGCEVRTTYTLAHEPLFDAFDRHLGNKIDATFKSSFGD